LATPRIGFDQGKADGGKVVRFFGPSGRSCFPI